MPAVGGCHLTRPIVDLLTSAGFTITELDVFYEQGAPKSFAADSLGIAVMRCAARTATASVPRPRPWNFS